jgi:hypothetical protein
MFKRSLVKGVAEENGSQELLPQALHVGEPHEVIAPLPLTEGLSFGKFLQTKHLRGPMPQHMLHSAQSLPGGQR